ncbi:hypothetical protein [Streptomyces griseorubiginosus]|nr:hypothetical protein [Streptomyces griseorubiginosus]WUB47261.1 hypothetical protein OHN19_29590 [Streptomyces griseorubiginosus]WUB55785.1 hypothetical protein OG942_29595 [Streptomyces griseorubiginosus]
MPTVRGTRTTLRKMLQNCGLRRVDVDDTEHGGCREGSAKHCRRHSLSP